MELKRKGGRPFCRAREGDIRTPLSFSINLCTNMFGNGISFCWLVTPNLLLEKTPEASSSTLLYKVFISEVLLHSSRFYYSVRSSVPSRD